MTRRLSQIDDPARGRHTTIVRGYPTPRKMGRVWGVVHASHRSQPHRTSAHLGSGQRGARRQPYSLHRETAVRDS
jgi:hypothetical protein